MPAWVVVVGLALISCVRSQSVTCDDGSVCPTNRVCDDVNHLCVVPDQLTSCLDRAEGEACTVNEPTSRPGECVNQVCVPAVCGDGITVLDEACDGPESVPAAGTCPDFNYDYGTLGCSAQCSFGLGECRRLGWQFASVPGIGRINGIWDDRGTAWAAGTSGVFRRRAGVWTRISDPVVGSINAAGVWASEDHVFVVGSDTTKGRVVHFDGAHWTGVALPVPVNAIYGRRPDDVFAVGSEGYIWHFDGAAWTAMASPVITGLRAIAGSGTDLVVVGDASTVLRLTASGWVRDLSATGPTGSLSGVWERAPNDLYVVGNGSKVAHWDGTTWVTSPLSGLTRNLRAISGRSASEIYIVGDADANGNTIVVGSSAGWTPMVNPSTENLFAVHAGASGTYAAAGAATMLEYEGAGWLELEPPAPTTRILGLWSNGASSVAVGEGCTLQVVTPGSYVTEGLFQTCSCGLSVLLDIWGTTGANGMPLYAGGTYGLLLHHTGNGWECDQPLPAPIATATSVVTSISGTSATSVFAVGRASNAPMLLHNAGTGWIDLSAELPALSGRRLNGVWAAGPDEAFMVGTEGNIAHYQGGVVTAMTSGVSSTLFSVWGANPRDVYAVGDEATILHYDGVAWKRVTGVPAGITFSTNVPFVDVHGRGSTDVWVVGGRVLLHWEGAHWQVVAQPATEPTTQVFATERGVTIGTALGIGHQLIGL